ncbi:MAG: CpsD/CapB family tyrosine-protein kinase [Lachnospiraceae bacterium]|nr:CpsD/CapB family tyrosine-protein kinase [Lachnospiraceae bacterium]MBQ4069382.1 hypothetical protein [Lachnospiraceae bacterium]
MKRIFSGNKQNLHKNPKIIAVMGSVKGAGCTHFAIALAKSIRMIYGKKTAIIELNGSGDFERIKNEYVRSNIKKNSCETDMYDIHNVSFYKRISHDRFFEIYGDAYEYIILDIGENFQKQKDKIILSDIKCLIACHTPWKYEDNNKAIKWFDDNLPNKDFKCFNCFGVTHNKKIFRQVPSYASPFELDKNVLSFFIGILED